MVTVENVQYIEGPQTGDFEFKGLSTDTKPTAWKGSVIAENSLFLEVDTGDFYYLESTATQGKTTLVEEQSFELDGEDFAPLQAEVFNNVPITVVFDGVEYVCNEAQHDTPTEEDFIYGGWDNGNFDYSVYPFVLMTDPNGVSVSEYDVAVYVDDDDQHTIEVYVDFSTPAVWKKVGSGGSTPTEEGYEINNHVLTINYNNLFDVEKESRKTFVDDNGYLSLGHISIPVGESTISTVVIGESDGEGGYDYNYDTGMRTQDISSTSNLVNCTYSDATVFIIDPTQDASIDIELHNNVG